MHVDLLNRCMLARIVVERSLVERYTHTYVRTLFNNCLVYILMERIIGTDESETGTLTG